MLISQETRTQLNNLVAFSFDANAVVDNYAYNLAYYHFPNIENIVHHGLAHKFPAFADIITNMMIDLDARPIRQNIGNHDEDFEGNLYRIFEGVLKLCNDYRAAIISTIETADLNDDYEVKIKLEEFLVMFEPYRKQADIWFKYAERYQDDYKSFDIHFGDITVLISAE